MKKVLFAVAAVALLTVAAQAGEIKYHNWPTGGFIPQELMTIPVKMDIGYWVRVKTQDIEIKLDQESISTYSGCVNVPIECNFALVVSASIEDLAGGVSGDFSVAIANPNVPAGGGSIDVCAKLENANLTGTTGGTTNVPVATVTLKVVPA
jgi:hypothetical protein